jgi:hypothetical protein
MFDSRSVAQRMMDFFKSTVDEVREKDRKNVKKLLGWEIVMDSVEKMPETFSLDFAYDYMRANSRKGFDFRKMLKPSALRRLLIEYGYEDLCGDELPMFRRTHVKDS